MKKVLDIAQPLITSYTDIAGMFSILGTIKNSSGWIINHFIQLLYMIAKDKSRPYFLDGTVRRGSLIIDACPFFRHNKVSKEVIAKKWDKFTDFLEEYLSSSYYVFIELNIKFLSIARTPDDFIHQTFIYGYDKNERKVYISDFYNGNAYSREVATYDEINIAFLHSQDNTLHESRNDVWCIKVVDEVPKIPPNKELIKQSLINFYESSEIDINPRQDSVFFFGLSFYEEMIRQMKKNKRIMIALHILYDHKMMMRHRIEILNEHGFIDPQNYTLLCLANSELIDRSLILRNLAAKAQFCNIDNGKLVLLSEELLAKDKAFTEMLIKSIC